jgi:SAM-dependent methyltransferase
MDLKIDTDINRGYVKFIKSLSGGLSRRQNGKIRWFGSFTVTLLRSILRIVLIPVLFLYGTILLMFLRTRLSLAHREGTAKFYADAIECIHEFTSQYPMHLYPVIAKSLELAFLKMHLGKRIPEFKGGIAELAIGEGTFSSRIFSHHDKVVGFDLNPYSLVHAKRYLHVVRRIIADCRRPPIASGGASLILCNNFLHHVTEKENALDHWSRMAPFAIFNENTNYWASGWFKPFVLKLLGFSESARQVAEKIQNQGLQTLWKADRLKLSVRKFYEIVEEQSFLSEKVFCLSAIFSSLLLCQGPPTPDLQKKIMNQCLAPVTKFFTYQIAKSLIEYDSILCRETDTFLCWFVRSKVAEGNNIPDDVTLVCPDCRGLLQDNKCFRCNKTFEETDDLLFLLAKEISYSGNQPNLLREEHL